MNIKIVDQIENTDFGLLSDFTIINGEEAVKIEEAHGTVVIVKGLIDDDPQALIPMGIIDGDNEARPCFWKPFPKYLQNHRTLDNFRRDTNGKKIY